MPIMANDTKKLILPPADFHDDQELGEWFDLCRAITIKASDELDEDSDHIHAVLFRYARRRGLGYFAARQTARSVALPISRASDRLESASRDFRVAARRLDAFVEAATPPKKRRGEFQIRGQK